MFMWPPIEQPMLLGFDLLRDLGQAVIDMGDVLRWNEDSSGYRGVYGSIGVPSDRGEETGNSNTIRCQNRM